MPFITAPAGALPVRVQSQSSSGTTASLSAVFGASPTPGNLLVAFVYSATVNSTVSMTTTGYALQVFRDFSASTSSVQIFSKLAEAGESTTVTAAATGSVNMRLHIIEYSGVTSATAIHTSTQVATAATTVAVPIAWTANPVVSITSMAGNGNIGAWVSWAGGPSSLITEARTQTGELISGSGALGNVTGTWTTARDAGMVEAAFRGFPLAQQWQTLQAVNRAGTF